MAAKKRKPKKKSAASGKKTPGAAHYLKVWKALDKGSKKNSVSMFSDDVVPTITEFIPTGNLAIDKTINGANGGWPIGGITEVAAWEHVCKSTLLDQSIAQCQRMGGVAVLIDSEKGRDRKWTELLGVDSEKLITFQADTIEEAYGGIDDALVIQEQVMREIGQPPPMLIVQDSLGGTPSKAELEGDADTNHMMVAARVIKMNLRRLTQRLSKLRVAYVFTNHFYNQPGSAALKTYGGSGPRYHTDLRLHFSRPGNIKVSDKIVGHVVECKTKKNRISGISEPIETALVYGAGMDNTYPLFKWGQKAANTEGHQWIQRSGANYWLYIPGESPVCFQRQFFGLGEFFKERPDIYQQMAVQYLNGNDGN
jgi:recombination protein RecA